MSRFVLDSMVVLLLLLIGISFLGDDGDSKSNEVSINQVIEDFESDVSNDEILDDGYGVVDETSYSSNKISGVTSSIGGFIVDGATFAVDIIQKIIKSVIG